MNNLSSDEMNSQFLTYEEVGAFGTKSKYLWWVVV